jgi:5'-phosphate synthase pdxT subunit
MHDGPAHGGSIAPRPRVGVLALQGDFEAHRITLERLGAEVVEVRTPRELATVSGLVLPGGESTTLLKLLDSSGLGEAIRGFHRGGRPLYGTCAGLILLAREVVNPAQESLGLIDVAVARNAYGRQVDSFEDDVRIAPGAGLPEPGRGLRVAFIRAPKILRVGEGVRTLAFHNGDAVLAESGNVLVATFHAELTDETRVHERFLRRVREAAAGRGESAGEGTAREPVAGDARNA